jgi:hypothetical protein
MKKLLQNRNFYLAFAGVLVGALLLTLFDGRLVSLQGWFAYTIVLGLGLILILLTWRWIQPEKPPSVVLTATLIALSIRILVGLVLIRALPVYGYDQNAQNAGYVYFDAYKRDTDAWDRARSDQPLLNAFTNPKVSDQYGGTLFYSAGIYRYLSPDAHRPLLVTSVNATLAVLGMLFAWTFVSHYFGKTAGIISVWLMALYPESVLLGASQMREPFLITALAAALWAYALWTEDQGRKSLILALVILFITLPISPPFILVLLVTIGLVWIWERKMNLRRVAPIMIFGLALAFFSIYFAARSWGALEGISGSLWQIILGWWEHTGGTWRINLVTDQSLNLDVLLTQIPTWSQIPFLVIFGLAQPFLPAALFAPGAVIWRVIGILRSVGWFFFIPFLAYAPILAIRKRRQVKLGTFFAFYIWITALIASYRAPSYQWDNPRYRVVYLVMQVALVGWVWVKSREDKDPWVARLGWALMGFCLVLSHWYLGRFLDTPSLSLPMTMIAALGIAAIILVAGLLRDYLSKKNVNEGSLEV